MLPKYEHAKTLFEGYGLGLTPECYDKLDCYASFLVEYNENVNLTALTAPEDVLVKHFLDSMLLTKYIEIPLGAALIDVGTGAGFPSVPVLLLRQDLHVTLLDSLNKRIVFLQFLSEKLGLEVRCIHGRAEEAAKRPELREQFDVATARAVAALPALAEYCLPFVKPGGMMIAMKGPSEHASDGARAAQLLGGESPRAVDYTLQEDARRLICIRKISQTSTKYPRNSGQIKAKPLI